MKEEVGKHRAWCRSLFSMLKDGGAWASPNATLIFRRRGKELVLTERMPWSVVKAASAAGSDVPGSAEELRAHQDREYELTKLHFEDAGIPVRVAGGDDCELPAECDVCHTCQKPKPCEHSR